MSGPPLVSVVVATRDRPALLRALLDSLRAQTLGPASFEVIVVDDGSEPETQAMLRDRGAGAGIELRALRQERSRGPGPARNAGWRMALAPLIAFTDDDCTADPRWLEAGLRAHRARPESIVQGRTMPVSEPGRGWRSRTVRVERPSPQYQTCNMLYPRALLERLGGFDERFGHWPGEDTDLAWRAIEAGRPAVFAADALVWHAVTEVTPRALLREAAGWSGTMRLFADHPGARAILTGGLFWNVWHYLLVRSLVALALPPGLRRLALARHLDQLRRRARREGAGPLLVPFLIVHDLVELASVMRGAWRHRTLVL